MSTIKSCFLLPDSQDILRCKAIWSQVWYLREEEREMLDAHFVLRSSSEKLLDEIISDEEDGTYFSNSIQIGINIYEISFMNTNFKVITENKSAELLLSFRLSIKYNLAVCIVQPRYSAMSNSKYYSIKELEV